MPRFPIPSRFFGCAGRLSSAGLVSAIVEGSRSRFEGFVGCLRSRCRDPYHCRLPILPKTRRTVLLPFLDDFRAVRRIFYLKTGGLLFSWCEDIFIDAYSLDSMQTPAVVPRRYPHFIPVAVLPFWAITTLFRCHRRFSTPPSHVH